MEQQLQMSGEMSLITDGDLSSVGETFKSAISHMKSALPFWDDLVQRGFKFQRQLEATIVAYNYFTDGFGKVADIAVRSKGGTRDMGTQLTTLVMWHKQLELKLRGLNQALATNFLASLQSKIEEFRKSASAFEKECDRELRKSITEAKGACSKTVKTSKNLEKKTKKEKFDEAQALRTELSKKQQEASERIQAVYDMEKRHLTKLLTEERIWYCTLVRDYQGVMNVGMSMIGDIQRLQDISQELSVTIHQPTVLPEKTIDYITEMCPLASQSKMNNDLQDSFSDSQRRGSYTPQPQRSTSAAAGLSRRSQSFDQLDDPSIYSEIPPIKSPLTTSYSAVPPAPLFHNSTPPPPIGYNSVPPPPPIGYNSVPPPPPIGYDSAPPPPPPPVHKPAQVNTPQDVEIHPEGPPIPPTGLTESVSPKYRQSGTDWRQSGFDWHSDLKEKLRRRAETVGSSAGNVGSNVGNVGSSSPKRPGTPLDDQMYVDVVAPAYSGAQYRSSSLSSGSPPPSAGVIMNQDRFSMTPPATPPSKRTDPPPPPPKPSKGSVSNLHDEDDASDSPLAKALKAAKLKRVATNDRSAPKV